MVQWLTSPPPNLQGLGSNSVQVTKNFSLPLSGYCSHWARTMGWVCVMYEISIYELRALSWKVMADVHESSAWSSRPWWITHTYKYKRINTADVSKTWKSIPKPPSGIRVWRKSSMTLKDSGAQLKVNPVWKVVWVVDWLRRGVATRERSAMCLQVKRPPRRSSEVC